MFLETVACAPEALDVTTRGVEEKVNTVSPVCPNGA